MKTVTLPHPGAVLSQRGRTKLVSRNVERALLPFGVAAVTGVWFSLGPVSAAALAAGLMLVRYVLRQSDRGVAVLVSENAVTLPDLTSLPKGQGKIVVGAEVYQGEKGQRIVRWSVSHSLRGILYTDCVDPLAVRAFAEGLAFTGGWHMVWRPAGELSEEVREPGALDASFVARELEEKTLQPADARVASNFCRIEPHPEGGITITWHRGVWEALLNAAVLGGVGFGIALWTAVAYRAVLPFVIVPPLALTGLLLRRKWLRVSTAGVEIDYLFGPWTIWRRRLASEDLESLYVELVPTPRLVAAGDEALLVLGDAATATEAEWLRSVVGAQLMGDASLAGTAATSSAPSGELREGTCPTCARVGLERVGGELDEERCPACGGRFLSRHGTERLVEEELRIPRDTLKDLTAYFGGQRRHCPACRSRLSAVQLKGVAAELCQGCGGLWLDAGELSALSQGRYEG